MQLSDQEWKELCDTIGVCYYRSRTKTKWYVLTWVAHLYSRRNNKICEYIKYARDSDIFSNTGLVMMINEAFETVKRMSESVAVDIGGDMLVLKDALQTMQEVNAKAEKVVQESDKISEELEKICEYIEGERESLPTQPVTLRK